LAKRLTEKQKEDIKKLFISGTNIDQISNQFNCTKLTITRNLKKNLGEENFRELADKNKKQQINNLNNKDINEKNKKFEHKENSSQIVGDEFPKSTEFIEISPLNLDIESSPQKDFSSIPISEINFPKTVFMVVDKKVELEIKYLKDYPKWQFLSQEELKRKTIEIYLDLKIAKSFCGKDHKVIKVPNTDVFKKVAPILLSRGISRIVTDDKLIAL
tara:strand:- start:246 stop:893 length:648 start_codon:yes stop_codon:yes gene_type:complete